MSAPTPEYCNVCKRTVYVCAACGKPSCVGGRTSCPACEQARAADAQPSRVPSHKGHNPLLQLAGDRCPCERCEADRKEAAARAVDDAQTDQQRAQEEQRG